MKLIKSGKETIVIERRDRMSTGGSVYTDAIIIVIVRYII